jgi:hypothetical protein
LILADANAPVPATYTLMQKSIYVTGVRNQCNAGGRPDWRGSRYPDFVVGIPPGWPKKVLAVSRPDAAGAQKNPHAFISSHRQMRRL